MTEQKDILKKNSKRIEELGIYYLYFLCSFMDKLTMKLKSEKIEARKSIPFRKIFFEDFLSSCEKIEVVSMESVDEMTSYTSININFCERFIYLIKNKGGGINVNQIRSHILKDLQYISFHYFGVFISLRDINIEDALEFFVTMISRINNKIIYEPIFNIQGKEEIIINEINSSYIVCSNKDTEFRENKEFYDLYIESKDKLNENLINLNNKIGYRFINKVISPYLEDLSIFNKSYYDGLNSLADKFLSCYFNIIQNEYFFTHINNILSLKDMQEIKQYINNEDRSKFVLLSDMENLVKNG